MGNLNIPTIVLIDSGVGGVSVLNRLIKNRIYANYVYIADNAFMPYGNKSKTIIKNRAEELLSKILQDYNPDCIVVACNTMSTCIEQVNNKKIVLMKFKKSKKYLTTKLTKENLKGYDVVADNKLASLIEKNLTEKDIISRIINNHLNKMRLKETNQLTLGCTHYELCEDLFKRHIRGLVECNSENIVGEIKNKLKNFSTKAEFNIVVETTMKSHIEQSKILKLIEKVMPNRMG